MNERVWLQFESPFVNMSKAIFPAIAASILVWGCSGPSDQGKSEEKEDDGSPKITVIWETDEADYPIIDIAAGRTQPDNLFISAVLGDERVQTFDLDGVIIASSTGPAAKSLSEGAPLSVSEEQFAAHLSARNDQASTVLMSPKLKMVASAPVENAPATRHVCKGASNLELGAVALATDTGLVLGNLERIGDAVTFTQSTTVSIEGGIKECLLVDEANGFIATDTGLFQFSASGDLNKLTSDSPRDLASVTHETGNALLWLGQTDGLVRVSFMDDLQASPFTFKLEDGLTVTAPTQMTSIATVSGRVSVDYPSGLFAATGFYDDARPRIAYASLDTIIQAASAARKD